MYDRLHKEEMGYRRENCLRLAAYGFLIMNSGSELRETSVDVRFSVHQTLLLLVRLIFERNGVALVCCGIAVTGYDVAAEDHKKLYLVLYNLYQFVGYTYVLAVMAVRYAKLEYDSVADTYEHVGPAMKFLQLLQYLEALHPLFGLTRGGALVPFLQVSGRAFVLFVMIDAEPRMHMNPLVFYLFIIWSMIEVVRYPYYISQLLKNEIYILTWLRYTMWIPLYPLGYTCEAIIMLRNISYLEETKRFTVEMPNEWNFAFHMPMIVRMYLLILTFPGMYFLLNHMHKLRNHKLKPKNIINKSE